MMSASRPWLRWGLLTSGGCATLGCGGFAFVILTTILIAVVFLGGIGQWASHLFTGTPPPMGTPTARSIEWLSAVERADPQLPAALGLAVIAQASGGEVYGDRYYCVQGTSEQSSGLPCQQAFGKSWKTLGESYGLMGLDSKDVVFPSASSANTPHTVAWNVATGLHRLAHTLAHDPLVQTALPTFHRSTQAPPHWIFHGYADTIRQDLATYGGPQMAIWAITTWNKVTGAYQDPHDAADWVIAVAAAPTGAPWDLEWKAPTVRVVTQTKHVPTTHTETVQVTVPGQTKIITHNVSIDDKTITTHTVVHTPAHTVTETKTVHGTKTVTDTVREIVTHNLSGRALTMPIAVYATLASGRQVPLVASNAPQASVPVWPGGVVWGAQIRLQTLRRITAVWPNGLTEVEPWPPEINEATGTIHLVNETQSIRGWWPDIEQASQATGTPASLIAAIMVHESSGQADAFNPSGPAYGLMQILPSTAAGLPGYNPATWTLPQENLTLGAELLAENEHDTGGWHAAIAAYYGGLGTMENDGYTPGMPWSEASVLLNVVPAAYAGNTQTMTSYADQMIAESALIAKDEAALSTAKTTARPKSDSAASASS